MTSTSNCPQCGDSISVRSPHQLCPKCLLAAGLGPGADPQSATTQAFLSDDDLGWSQADLDQRFPQLEIQGLIGRGGMGAVYRARQKTLDRVVALKVLPAKASRDASFAERFVREARTMAKLNHPHVVTVYEFGENDGLYFFLMEFVDGANLRSLMSEGRLRSGEALSIVGQVCDALQYAHEMGIVHRDIKPENVLIDQRGQVKIADFGLAKIMAKPLTDVTLTGVHQVVGTPHYMAPEQFEKPTEVDHRADIYSLGVVFYELLTGELPLGRFARPSEKSDVDASLDDVVLRTLEKEPANRYQSAVAMKTDCSRVAGDRKAEAPPAPQETTSTTRQLSLACTLPSQFEGFYDYVGLLKLDEDERQLLLQYRGQESFTGSSLAGTKEQVFPLQKVDTIELKFGVAGPMLLLTPNDLMIANKVPGMEKGKVRIKFAREDRQKAITLIRACDDCSGVEAIIPVPPTEAEALRDLRAPAIALLLYAMISILVSLVGGGAAVLQTFEGLSSSWLQTFLLGGSVVSAALHLFVVVGAIQMYFAANRGLAYAAAICCFVPTGPGIAVGIGLGIWALIVLNREETTQLFQRGQSESDRAVYGFQAPANVGKPASRDALRQEAAARLRMPIAALKVCGWINIVGVVATLGAIRMWTEWTSLGQVPFWAYPAAAMLVNGCTLVFARTDLSRALLMAICIIGALPVSPVWPLSVCFAVWALLVLLDPDVRELYEEEEPLPHAVPSDAAKMAVIVLFSVVISLGLMFAVKSYRSLVQKPAQIDWRLVDPQGGDFAAGDGGVLIKRVNDRLKNIDSGIVVRMSHDEPLVDWALGDADEQLATLQLMGANGQLEIALLRDADDDAQGATDPAVESDDLRFDLSGDASPAGLRLAVVRDTRWPLAANDFDSIDLSSRGRIGARQTLTLELNDSSIPVLSAKLKRVLAKRQGAAKPLQLALIVDDVVYGSAKLLINDEIPLRKIEFEGSFPWSEEQQLAAVLQSGPLGGSMIWVKAAAPDGVEAAAVD